MREVLFKNLTSLRSRKKDISLKEVFENNGIITKTERRCFYFIKDVAKIDDMKDLEKIVGNKYATENVNKRHFHILKERRDELGEDKIVCKIMGILYALVGKNVYTIAFLHSFKAHFVKSSLAK